jgi:hypothetical protein
MNDKVCMCLTQKQFFPKIFDRHLVESADVEPADRRVTAQFKNKYL